MFEDPKRVESEFALTDEVEMAVHTKAAPVDRLVSWINEKNDASISVEELYVKGPERLGLTELEVRELVNEGIRQRVLAIGGLTSLIRVRKGSDSAA